MNNIIWYQPAKLTDNDIIIKNGICLEEGSERTEVFLKIKKVSEKAIGKQRPWHGKIGNFYFIKGNFDEKDERGRFLSFLFISDTDNGKKAFIDTLKIIDKKINANTAKCLALETSPIIKHLLLWGVGLVLLALIIYLIIFFD